MRKKIIFVLVLLVMNYPESEQDCKSEVNIKGLPVTWPKSPEGINLTSFPICSDEIDQVIRRNCTEGNWIPSQENISSCVKIYNEFIIDACPPGYAPINYNDSIYCFETTPVSGWNYPCYQSGGASVLSDLHSGELESLLDILNSSYSSQYYWLPAKRVKRFNPLVWTIPGPNWGTLVSETTNIPFYSILFKNCLKLDVKNRFITTEYCNVAYPSLCLYIKDINYPADCPNGYRAIRYMNDFNACFGIERSISPNGSTFGDFLTNQCDKPMGNNKDFVLTSFIFQNMAAYLNLSEDLWCWFSKVSQNNSRLAYFESVNTSALAPSTTYEGVINRQGSLGLLDNSTLLPCMACEKDMIFSNTEFLLNYQQSEQMLRLTVFTPWGLWKYNDDDNGFRCFSNAKGFINPVSADRLPLSSEVDEIDDGLDKVEYIIIPISDRVGEYWCEGHTKDFVLISSNVVMVSLESANEHVFALCVELKLTDTEINFPDLTDYKTTIQKIYDAENVILMDILEVTEDERAIVIIHVHVALSTDSDMYESNIGKTLLSMKNTAIEELCEHNITFVNISSSMYCLPTVSEDVIPLKWPLTAIGQIAAPIQFCLDNNGLPVKRKCLGTYITGAVWGPVEGSCKQNYQPSNTTTFLYEFAMRLTPEYYTTRFLTVGLSYVLNDIDIIIPADIYYLSMSLKHISQVAQENSSCLELGDLENIAWTMDRLMVLNNHYLNLAQTLNSTNVILDSVTNIIEVLATTNITHNMIRKTDKFYQHAVQPQFITQYSYPRHNNISGIALLRPKNTSSSFTNMTIIPLYVNTSLDEILSQEDLEIATWVPEKVLKTLEPLVNKTGNNNDTLDSKDDIYIVINIFYNDAIFQEVDKRNHVINSNIIEIEIPGFSTNLKHSIPLIFKALDKKQNNIPNFCGYWDFQDAENATVPGFWNKNGCYFLTKINDTVVCKCMHLTHFAQLITPSTSNNRPPKENYIHSRALNIITLVGSFLSLGGILGIWITATVFSIWRRKAGTKVLLQLSLAIAMPLIIIIIFSFSRSIFVIKDGLIEVSDSRKVLCIVLGALLHYSILVGFVWMLITAVLQFVRYVRVIGVTRPARFMIKLTLIGWGLPTLPVALVLLINKDNYLPSPSNSTAPSICYPTGIYFFLSVLFPIVVIVIINISLFISVIVSISKGPGGKMRTVDLDLVKAQMRLSVFLFFLLGLTWVFGIFSFSDSLVWSYLFCLTSTMQGFVLFVYFVVCDPSTRNLWITLVKPQFRSFSSRESITSLSH